MANFLNHGRSGWHAAVARVSGAFESVSDRMPKPLRRVIAAPSVHSIVLVAVAFVIVGISGPFSYTSYVVLLIGIYLISVLGLNVTIGFSGVLSLGQGASFAFGAYIAGVLAGTYLWPIWLTLPLALLGGLLVGAIIGLPSVRLAALGLAMISLGLVLVVNDMLVQLSPITNGASGIAGISPFLGFNGDGFILSEWFIPVLILVLTGVAYWVHQRYRASRIGRATVAVKDEAIGAAAVGIGGYSTKILAFAVGSGMAGLAGALFSYLSAYISPDAFSPSLSILFLVMVVLGGLGSLLGPAIGAILLVIIPLALAPYPHVNAIVYGLLLVVLMRLRPRGLFSRTAARARPVLASLGTAHRTTSASRPPTDGGPLLVASDVKRSFGGVKALDGVSMQLASGEVLGLIGPNGSGKTTLLNILGGYYHPSSGTVEMAGVDISRARPNEIARAGVSRTFQTPKTFDGMSIDEHIEIALEWQVDAEAERVAACRAAAIRFLELGGLDPSKPKPGRRESRTLGHGQLRFLEAAMAVARCPRLLLLDEPAAGLSGSEIEGFEAVVKDVARAGVGVIIVEHHLDMVSRLVDRIVVLDLGKVLWEGKPADLHDAAAVRVAYMGTV
jgi:branched-chain amino acid transport system permease protein